MRCKNMKRNEDRMSELSDDILTCILSRLTFREAAATSVLSTRWRYLCAYVTHLDFPPFKPPQVNVVRNQEQILSKFQAYTKSIDHMLDSHKGNRVKELRVEMHCAKGGGGANIDKWLQFAVAKQAEIIALGMIHGGDSYSLQLQKLMVGRVRVLRELSLSGIDVDGSDVEVLLSSFPLLESLSLAECWTKLRKVSMVGGALKHVAICYAPYLELVEIEEMMSLVSLRLRHLASPFTVKMNNAPKLIELSTLDGFNCSVPRVLAGISPSIRAQLLTLKIRNDCYLLPYPTDVIPEFQSVKHLELECVGAELLQIGYSLRRFFLVIQACPALENLEIKMVWPQELKVKEDEKREILVRKQEVCPYLKRIKLLGFLGSAAELGLVLSILWHANSLQELIVEACDVNEKARGIATARSWQHLLPKIPSSAVLQLI